MFYKHVILGGTFDHFHLGHQQLIKRAYELSEKITIGITKNHLFKNKVLSEMIESYLTRKNSVTEFLAEKGWLNKTKIIAISDIYGTTLVDINIDAVIVSQITKKNAEKINEKRSKIGFPQMKIIIIDDVLAEDEKLITSERIRIGEIDRKGISYWKILTRNQQSATKQLVLPISMREQLRRPLGKVTKFLKSANFSKLKKIPLVIAVGDIIVKSLLDLGFDPDIKVIDFKSRRQKIKDQKLHITNKRQIINDKHYLNNPGTVNIETANRLKQLIDHAVFRKQKSWLAVDGEEDLLTLPAILFAPLGSLVLYGQWDRGVVVVLVTEEMKKKVCVILNKFK